MQWPEQQLKSLLPTEILLKLAVSLLMLPVLIILALARNQLTQLVVLRYLTALSLTWEG